MSEQRRFVVFITISMGILVAWQLVPWLMPRKPPVPVAANLPAKTEPEKEKETEKPKEKKPAPPVKPAVKVQAKHTVVELGDLKVDSGYRMKVTIDSKGAAVTRVTLGDKRYPDADDRSQPLVLVGHDNEDPLSLTTRLQKPDGAAIPEQFDRAEWELVPGSQSISGVTYRYEENGLEMRKKFTLSQVDPKAASPERPAYELRMDLTVSNTGDEPRELQYVLTGPCSLPLENPESTPRFLEVTSLLIEENGSVSRSIKTAAEIAKQSEASTKRVKYIGVTNQYFAALIQPVEDQTKDRTIQETTQGIVPSPFPPAKPEHTDVTALLTSVPLSLPAGAKVTHGFTMFAGPKRDDLVDSYVLDYGWFGAISRVLLALLKFFYTLIGNYGVAIICLTIVVRSCMLPISIKQARMMAKMQALQPEIAALKAKYGDEKEKMAAAQMELFSRHKVNPLGGCLPVLLQMPVFIGLYQSLSQSVELRMAPFLWIDNLAAPEKLFHLPFAIPFLGEWFNFLPIVTVGLFLVQQKLFTPPAVDEQGKQQQFMMNVMTVVMGVMFYNVAAGLCIYFIASSLWGIAERLLINKMPKPAVIAPPESDNERRGRDDDNGRSPPPTGKPGGFWSMLLDAAEKERSIRKEKTKK